MTARGYAIPAHSLPADADLSYDLSYEADADLSYDWAACRECGEETIHLSGICVMCRSGEIGQANIDRIALVVQERGDSIIAARTAMSARRERRRTANLLTLISAVCGLAALVAAFVMAADAWRTLDWLQAPFWVFMGAAAVGGSALFWSVLIKGARTEQED